MRSAPGRWSSFLTKRPIGVPRVYPCSVPERMETCLAHARAATSASCLIGHIDAASVLLRRIEERIARGAQRQGGLVLLVEVESADARSWQMHVHGLCLRGLFGGAHKVLLRAWSGQPALAGTAASELWLDV